MIDKPAAKQAQTYVAFYLDCDVNNNTLVDNNSSDMESGWYLFAFPAVMDALIAGPFQTYGGAENAKPKEKHNVPDED